jgi:hypothetical protein
MLIWLWHQRHWCGHSSQSQQYEKVSFAFSCCFGCDNSATDVAILHNANNEKVSFAFSSCFGCDTSATDAAILHNANNEKVSFAFSCCFGCDSSATVAAILHNANNEKVSIKNPDPDWSGSRSFQMLDPDPVSINLDPQLCILHNSKNSRKKFPEKKLRGLSPNFYIRVPVSD